MRRQIFLFILFVVFLISGCSNSNVKLGSRVTDGEAEQSESISADESEECNNALQDNTVLDIDRKQFATIFLNNLKDAHGNKDIRIMQKFFAGNCDIIRNFNGGPISKYKFQADKIDFKALGPNESHILPEGYQIPPEVDLRENNLLWLPEAIQLDPLIPVQVGSLDTESEQLLSIYFEEIYNLIGLEFDLEKYQSGLFNPYVIVISETQFILMGSMPSVFLNESSGTNYFFEQQNAEYKLIAVLEFFGRLAPYDGPRREY